MQLPADPGFSKSALEISRSFAPPRAGGRNSGTSRGSVQFSSMGKSTMDAAADAVTAADAEELETATKVGRTGD